MEILILKGCSHCHIHNTEERFYTPYIDMPIFDIINDNTSDMTIGNIFSKIIIITVLNVIMIQKVILLMRNSLVVIIFILK